MFLDNLSKSLRHTRGDFVFASTFFWLVIFLFSGSLCAQPKAFVAESKKSFGSVKRGQLVELAYEVKNTGNSPLLLTGYEVSCSCTQVEFSKEPVFPGKSSTVRIKFDTKSVWGRQDRTAYLLSNDTIGELKLRYKGQVSKD